MATYATGGMITHPYYVTAGTTSAWTAPSDRVWHQWMTSTSSSTTFTITTNQLVWDNWLRDEREHRQYYNQLIVQQPQNNDELQRRREQHSREQLAADQQRQRDHATARSRALDLLDNLLTEEERALRDTEQRIALRGSDGHLYWLEMHRETVHGNIVRTDEHGCMLGRACVAPGMRDGVRALPTADGWVGQYLGLKFDAASFLSHANWSSVRTCRVGRVAA